MDEYQKFFLKIRTSEIERMLPQLEAEAEAAYSIDSSAGKYYTGARNELYRRASLHKPKNISPFNERKPLTLKALVKAIKLKYFTKHTIDDSSLYDAIRKNREKAIAK